MMPPNAESSQKNLRGNVKAGVCFGVYGNLFEPGRKIGWFQFEKLVAPVCERLAHRLV
jgi:hypothetical protein